MITDKGITPLTIVYYHCFVTTVIYYIVLISVIFFVAST